MCLFRVDWLYFLNVFCCDVVVLVGLQVEDQMKLLQNCWSELLVLDVIFRQVPHADPQKLHLVSARVLATPDLFSTSPPITNLPDIFVQLYL